MTKLQSSANNIPIQPLSPDQLTVSHHVRYFSTCLVSSSLPAPYKSLDTNRLTLVHFAVQSLDVLNSLDKTLDSETKHQVINWIYALFITLTTRDEKGEVMTIAGFKGGTFMGPSFYSSYHHDNNEICNNSDDTFNHVHIAMTYTALCTLAALGDDLSRLVPHKQAILHSLRLMQQHDGSFTCATNGSGAEHDLRFLYCACAISYMLQDWSGVNIPNAIEYIKSCRSYDGGIGLLPGQEGHGGSTFCAIASLVLMGKLDQVLVNEWWQQLIHWCVHRQTTAVGGMQGRPNKVDDTCYSYWIGGTLRLLQCDFLIHQPSLQDFVLSCQTIMGGFGKVQGAHPDLLHSFYSLAWLSLSQQPRHEEELDDGSEEDSPTEAPLLQTLDCALGICQKRTSVFRVFDES